jgi:peptide/nickel transport system substrate-binding protein
MLLLPNEHYWQKGRPLVKGARYTAMAGNEQRLQALITNTLDWGGGYIPNIDKVYVHPDPSHHHFWWPLSGMVDLVVNHTRPPFDQLKVRQALSLAMDREAMVQAALQGHSKVADITNLPIYPYSTWIDKSVVKSYSWLMKRDVDRANSLLEEAGLKKGSGGVRTLSDGSAMRYQISVPTGWTDFISDCEVITNNCKDIGVDLTIYTPSVDTWYNNVYPAHFDMCLDDPGGFGATPFEAYRGYLSSQTYEPVGTSAQQNWQRYKNADADTLLNKFAATSSLSEQKSITVDLQRIFAENLPVIPLYYEPEWGAYNTMYFTDFPNLPHPYAPLSEVSSFPTYNIVLNHIKPR